MNSQSALYQYKYHGPLPTNIGKVLLDSNPKARLRGYCSGPGSWVGPYDFAVIDLCDLEATIHAFDPDELLREGHDDILEEI
jgi:hypothetical protein